METVIKGGILVTESDLFSGDILVSGEKITAVAQKIPTEGRNVVDASGCYVFAGFIDTHTHFDLEGACRTADDFYSGTRAALAGGTTMVLDFALQERGTSSLHALQKWHEKAEGRSSCDYGFHMSFTEWNTLLECELPDLFDEGISSFKLYMAYESLRVDEDTLAEALKKIGNMGGITGVHCEDWEKIKNNIQNLLKSDKKSVRYHPISRPPETESEAIRRCIAAAEKARAPVNIVHISTKKGMEEVRKAKKRGGQVYAETCPQYLLLDESEYEKENGFESAKYVMSPPLRNIKDTEALWKALGDGTADTIGTDHCSFNFKNDKELGKEDFSKIPNGIPGVEHRPALIYTYGVLTSKISLIRMAQLLSSGPAKLFGLYPQKGVLKEGSDADIVIWDPKMEWVIRASDQLQNVDYTPYEGMKTAGRARTVFLRGSKVVDDGRIVIENSGKFIKRHKSTLP